METPGPGDYQSESSQGMRGLGRQVSSTKKSSAAFSMGKASRSGFDKLHVDKEISKSLVGRETLGVQFLAPDHDSIGKRAVDSRKKTASSFSFGRASREKAGRTFLSKAHSKLQADPTTATVGLISFECSVGARSSDSRRPTSPRATFGSAPRSQPKLWMGRALSARGPNTTTHKAEFLPVGSASAMGGSGRQVLSSKKTAPSFGFGTSSRRHMLPTAVGGRRMKKAV